MKVTQFIQGNSGHRPAPRLSENASKVLSEKWWHRQIRIAVSPKSHLYYA